MDTSLSGVLGDVLAFRDARDSRFKASRQDLVTTHISYLSNRRPDRWRRSEQFDVQVSAPAERGVALEEVVGQHADGGRKAARIGFTQGVQEAIE